MMTFKIVIECNGKAFGDTVRTRSRELHRILAELASDLESQEYPDVNRRILDSNGAPTGHILIS